MLRVLKLARSVRGLKIIRMLRFIRPLRILLFSIAITLKSLVWSVALLLLIIYLFSILFADAYLNQLETLKSPDLMAEHFGTLLRSMHTLFRAISGGLEWRHATNALDASVGPLWSYIFTCYIAFCCFAVLNVMTGVFCHSAITGAEQDPELMVQSMVNEQERIKAAFAELFRQMDKDRQGTLDIHQFENSFHVESVRSCFEALGIKAADAWTIFRSLDKDGDLCVAGDEFINGCINVRGPAREVDLLRQSAKTRKQLESLAEYSEDLLAILQEVAIALQVTYQQPRRSQKSDARILV
ncbi:unnamed protein product [Effrenium voratum]|nr:unnamed protein product [Effrenium voratum]